MMTLGDIALDVAVTVTRVGGERAFRRRLMELGILPGTRVEVVRVAPLGDPLEIRARGCFLSIRRNEARFIDVTEERMAAEEPAVAAAVPMSTGLPASS
jgi:ferrous iron transport protein A